MYSPNEAIALEKHNYHRIKELIHVNYIMGYNLKKATRYDFILKLWCLVLIGSTLASYYGHMQLIVTYIKDIPRISESISTIFQSFMSVVKMLYTLTAPRKFYIMLRCACRHELLQSCELFEAVADLPIAKELRQNVDKIMNKVWISTRRQVLFFLFSCSAICLNYFLNSLIVIIYRFISESDDNVEVTLPLPSLYPNWMTYPYYYLPWFLETCNLYVCGMGAVAFEGLFGVLCLHGIGLMKTLSYMIDCSTSPLVPQERRLEYLRNCIYQYQRVAAYAMELNSSFRQIIIVQFVLSLFCWGLVLFQISIGIATSFTTALRMFLYLAAGGYQIVIYCYNGQSFSTASERIPMAFYECAWYEECREFRRLVKMMIMRTNLGFSLDVSWFTKMSLPTLVSMIRASGQYFVLLQNIM
ncbi:odorant receptor 63a, partial [Drosophila grimshawi]